MKIKTLVTLSAPMFTFSRNAEYDVEPNLAKSLINSGHATLVSGGDEKFYFPADFPAKEKLYHHGYKTPDEVKENFTKIAKSKGYDSQIIAAITNYFEKQQQAFVPTLPPNMPHAAILIENEITSVEQYMNRSAGSLSFLSVEQIAEINEFLDAAENTATTEVKKMETTESKQPAKAANTTKQTAKGKGKK